MRSITVICAALAAGLLLVVPPPVGQGESLALELGRVPGEFRPSAPALFTADLEDPSTLGIGRIARDVSEHLPAVEQLSRWIDGHSAELGWARVRPVVARDNAEMIDFLRRGIVDVVSETPLSALQYVHSAGASLLLRERRKGHSTYSSVVFVRADSPYFSLSDLRGRRIAFEDAGSTSAFLLPLASIKRAGLSVTRLDDATAMPRQDSVGYYFTLSESSIATAVLRGVADAGALSNEEFGELENKQPERAATLRVIQRSEPVPRAFLLTGPSVSAEQRESLRRLMLSMQDDSQGRRVLQAFNKIDRFDAIDAAMEGSISELQTTYALVEDEVARGAR